MIRKTAAITVSSIAGIVLAGGAAVGANVGILTAASSSPLGQLSAEVAQSETPETNTTGLVSTTVPTTVTVTAPETSTSVMTEVPDNLAATSTSDETEGHDENEEDFAVDVAGVVEVRTQNGTLKVTEVEANAGWTWKSGPDTPTSVKVTFILGDDKFEFAATLNADGTISATINQTALIEPSGSTSTTVTTQPSATTTPTVTSTTAPTATTQPVSTTTSPDDSDDDKYDDSSNDTDDTDDTDDDDDTDDGDDDEYEGKDDDD